MRFLAHLQDVLIILLLIAIAIAAGLWAYGPKLQLAALRAMSSADAAVIRDGERRSIPAAEIVPGDITLIEEGDTIPADGRLLESAALQTAEAALTESLPVSKDTDVIADEVAWVTAPGTSG